MGTDAKINVCHLISGDLWAGAEVQMYTLAKSLKAAPGLNIFAIVLNEGKLARKLREAQLEVTVIDESKNNFFRILKVIENNLRGRQVDILHSHRYKENVLGALLKKSGDVRRLVQTVHGIGEPFKSIKMIKAKLYAYADLIYTRKYFDKILTVSYDIQKRLSRKIEPDKIVTIHNAVDPARMAVNKEAGELRKELGIGYNEPVIGTVGRMVPVKGYDIFLKAARLMLERKPNIKFLLVGDGPSKSELENKARALNLADSVRFLGFRDDIINIINCFDVFVISSYHEGIPMAALEAMALKKPVVATAVGGINEIIENDVSGVLVNPGDPCILAEACSGLLNNAALKEKIQIGAAKRINDEFSIYSQREKVIKLYRELMNQR